MRSYRPSNINYWLYAICTALLFILYKGYLFGSSDQSEHLPPVYQLFDSALYSGDYYMKAYHEAFSIRFYYVWFVYLLSNLLTVEWTCFLMTIFSASLVNYSFMKITRHISSNEIAPYLVPLFLIGTVDFTIGGNHLLINMFVCSTLAKALGAFGLYHFFREKYYVMAVLLGLATLFQALVGLQLALALGAMTAYFLLKKGKWVEWLKVWGLYVLIAAFMLGPLVYLQFFGNEKYNMSLYYYLMYVFRNPVHFQPSLFPAADYIRFFILVLAALGVLLLTRFYSRQKLFIFLGIILAGMGLYALLMDVLHVPVAGKLQWFKTTVWGVSFSALILAVGLAELITRWIKHYFVLSILRLLVPVGLLIMPLMILNGSILPYEKLKSRYQIGDYEKSDLQQMHMWIRENTPVNAVFLVPPDDDSFACEARRSQVTGFKAIVHEPRFLIPWYSDIVKAYGVDSAMVGLNTDAADRMLKNYQNRADSVIDLSFDFRLHHLNSAGMLPAGTGKEVYRTKKYALTCNEKTKVPVL